MLTVKLLHCRVSSACKLLAVDIDYNCQKAVYVRVCVHVCVHEFAKYCVNELGGLAAHQGSMV